MKKIKEQLAAIAKTLSGLSRQVNRLGKKVAKQATAARAGAKPGRRAGSAPRVRANTVLDSVYGIIRRSRNGIGIAQLKNKTALGDRQLSNALYKLVKKGMVHTKARGVYVKS